jgi:hypothetical protein
VQRGKRGKLADGRNDNGIDQRRLAERLASMDHAMADAEELPLILDDPVILVHTLQEFEGLTVVRKERGVCLFVEGTIGPALPLLETAGRASDLLYQARHDHGQVCGVEDLVFDGRAPAVEDGYFHETNDLSY